VRFLAIGRLPLDRETAEFHRDRMSERRHAAGGVAEGQRFTLVEHDVLQIARGEYAGWPLA
jgi:glutamate mutase epsilon subunit